MTLTVPNPLHEYRLFGLAIRSELPLPELFAGPSTDADAVDIRIGIVPDEPSADDAVHWLRTDGTGAILTVNDIGRFRIDGGREIVIDPHPAASERNVRLFLLGSAMGVLLHQRGLLPLHANAIEIGGRAAAFLGHSGAGKSTLAAAFHDAGYRILSDDVCVVLRNKRGFMAQPGIPRLRLWRDAVERSGRTAGDHERAFDSLEKYTVRTDQATLSEALPMGAIYLLTRQDEGSDGLDIRRLSGVEAVRGLFENTYRGSFIEMVGDSRRHFESCLQLTNDVPVYELRRPWDGTRIDQTIVAIAAHLRSS